jgi:bacillithiol biosynthesis cysteine-adding enzyme BshC
MTANASSLSVPGPPEALAVDLAAAGRLAPLPAAFLAGSDNDLLAPLRFWDPRGGGVSAPAAVVPPPPPKGGPAADRGELAAALAVSNRAYGHAEADRLGHLLADPETRVVVTGQQPGLFGGPLYTMSKAVAAARHAAALEAAGQPAVAVFWVATEDHDYAEVATTTVLTAEGPRTFTLGPDPAPLRPVGMRALGPGVTEVLRGIAEAMPGEGYAEWLRTLGRWYRPEARFGEAFCRLLPHLLGAHCPLLLDAMHPALKAAERPWLARLVERRVEAAAALARRESEVTARGYELRVQPQPGASPLFLLHDGERRRIEWRGADGFALRGREDAGGSVAELLRIIDENPSAVTPGALARPAIQDAVLGSVLQVLGGGELSYMVQAAALYPVLGVEPPWVALRPQALVLEQRQLAKLAELGLPLADVLAGRERLDRLLAERSGGDFVTPVRRRIEAALGELGAPALAADVTLERPFEKTREQVLRSLDLFAEKALAAAARRDELQARRAEQLRATCLPGDELQERVVSGAHFYGRYGERFAASFWEQLDLDPRRLQVISP